jgi:hypothetical protein
MEDIITRMEYEVIALEPFIDWFNTLSDVERTRVIATVNVLRSRGVTLRFPLSSGLEGSSHGELRELRAQAAGTPIRVAYGFDPKRRAVLLLGGNKTGDDRFYEWFVPSAEKTWEKHLATLNSGEETQEPPPAKGSKTKGNRRP